MQSQSQSQTQVNRLWRPAAFGGIMLSLVGFYEPVKDIYLKFNNPDYRGLRSVRFAARQQELADQNAACFLEMQRGKIQVNDQLAISYGACPNTHVHIGVYPTNRSAYQRWLEPNREGEARMSALFPAAFAAMPALGDGAVSATAIPAQMQLRTVCQNWANQDRTRIVRITDEAGQCYFERVNVLSGVIEIRENVPCEAQCDAVAQKFN